MHNNRRQQAPHVKLVGFLTYEFAKREHHQCVSVELIYSPGNAFKDDQVCEWIRETAPDVFELAKIPDLAWLMIDIAEGRVDAKPAGEKHRFVVRTRQHLGDRHRCSFTLQPTFIGNSPSKIVEPVASADFTFPECLAWIDVAIDRALEHKDATRDALTDLLFNRGVGVSGQGSFYGSQHPSEIAPTARIGAMYLRRCDPRILYYKDSKDSDGWISLGTVTPSDRQITQITTDTFMEKIDVRAGESLAQTRSGSERCDHVMDDIQCGLARGHDGSHRRDGSP